MSITDNVYGQAVVVSIVGGTASSISGGKFANGATTAAMAFAFNQVASDPDWGQETESRESVCSDDICVGYTWRWGEPERIPGSVGREVWHGVESIPFWKWTDVAPPLGRKALGAILDIHTEYSHATETGHIEYPFVRFREYVQYVDNRAQGTFSVRRVNNVERVNREIIYQQLPNDTTTLSRARWRACVTDDCFYFPR